MFRKETGSFGEIEPGGALQGKEPQKQIDDEDLQGTAVEPGGGCAEGKHPGGGLAGKPDLHQGQGQAQGPPGSQQIKGKIGQV